LFVCQEAVARLEEMKKSIEAKVALRQSNLNPERPGWLCFEIFLALLNCLLVTETDKINYQFLVLLIFLTVNKIKIMVCWLFSDFCVIKYEQKASG
jgi:hypothetical protein